MQKRLLQAVSFLMLTAGCLIWHPGEAQAVTDFSKEYITEDNQYIYMNEYESYVGDGTEEYTLYKYIGSDSVICPPEEINGVPVVKLGDAFLSNNMTVQELYIPESIEYIVDADGYSLEKIEVDSKNNTFFSENGILYRKNDNGKGAELWCYPRNRVEDTFIVPDYVTGFYSFVFFKPNYLKTIIVNDNVQEFSSKMFCGNKQIPLTIYLNIDDLSDMLGFTIFSNLADGSKIIVKNEESRKLVKENVEKYNNCGEVEVISMSENPEYAIPAESLAFKDGTKEQSLTIAPGDCKALCGTFEQLPCDCTETLTWESSDASVVSVETGSFQEDGLSGKGIHMKANKCGECDITGTNESGMQVVYHVKVYKAMEELWVSRDCPEYDPLEIVPGKYEEEDQRDYQTVNISYAPYNCYAKATGEIPKWEIENEDILDIVPNKNENGYDYSYYISEKKPGKTKVTVTVNDDGTEVSKSFYVAVYGFLEDCEIEDVPDQQYEKDTEISPKPQVTYHGSLLEEGVDYDLKYYPNSGTYDVKAGTITKKKMAVIGKDYLDGLEFLYYNIVGVKADITDCEVKDISDQRYVDQETEICPKPEITCQGVLLEEGVDYDLAYDPDSGTYDAKAGTITGKKITVTGKGSFEGERYLYYNIVGIKEPEPDNPQEPDNLPTEDTPSNPSEPDNPETPSDPDSPETPSDPSDPDSPETPPKEEEGSGRDDTGTDTGNDTKPEEGTGESGSVADVPSSGDNPVTVPPSEDTDASKNNQTGGGTSAGTENAAGESSTTEQTKTNKVTVKQASVTSVRTSGKKALSVKWKKVSGTKGYQIQASLKKSFKSAKTMTVKKGSQTSAKVKGLKSGKKYYVRVRAYKTVNGKKVYGKWSKVKSCKVK